MRKTLRRFTHGIVRISAFISKEIAEIMRQPRLVLTLVLGPFLILFLFGIGYRNQAQPLRTLFVTAKGSPVGQQIQEFATSLGPQLIFMGITEDEAQARERLLRNEVDVVVLAPPDAYQTVEQNNQAVFTLIHNEIDPNKANYIQYFGQVYVDEVNRRVLQTAAGQGQTKSAGVQNDIKDARASTALMKAALQRGDASAARQGQRSLDSRLSAVELAVGASASLLGGVQQTTGNTADPAGNVTADLNDARQGTNSLSNIPDNQNGYAAELQRLDKIDRNLASLQTDLAQFQKVSPTVLVSPFRSEVKSMASIQPTVTDYFAPAVIVLLLQHLALTFAALSIVRERQLGAMELFRVAPLSAFETLLGKYLSYMIFGTVLAALLSALIVFGLHVPMLGDWGYYALTLAALLFTSLGLGFVLSLLSQTDSQAVQYAMIVLLTSVFFSGFIMSLNTLLPAVQIVSWMLPATYGISLLQNIMLRGYFIQPLLLTALAGIGVALFILAWLLLRSRMART
jgi:ABC-2 type transport system permease protein